MVQRGVGGQLGGRTGVHSSCPVFVVCAPRAHHLQDAAVGELLEQGQGWTCNPVPHRCCGVPTFPYSTIVSFGSARGKTQPLGCICPQSPLDITSIFPGCRETSVQTCPARLCVHTLPSRTSCTGAAKTQAAGNKPTRAGTTQMENLQTSTTWLKPSGQDPYNLLAVTLPSIPQSTGSRWRVPLQAGGEEAVCRKMLNLCYSHSLQECGE